MKLEVEQAKSGLNTLKINNYYLHSKYDPLKEATTFVAKNYEVGKTVILYGYGLGYIADRFNQSRELNEKLIIIDPFVKISEVSAGNTYFIDCEKVNDLSNYLNSILTDEDTGRTEVICSPNYRKIDENMYKETFEIISNVLKAKIINYNTIQSLAWTWYENFVDNMRFVLRDTTITTLFKSFSCPVIVVAGGPSLTKQLPLLKNIKGKCLILSAGSTIRTLLKNNIEPDFIVNVDGGEKNLEHFDQLKDSKINYIYGLQSTAGIREKFLGDCFYFSPMSEPLSEKFVGNFIPDIKKIEGGVSVATYTLAIASYLTSGPIALIGQDLAYTNNSSHADGNVQQVKKDYKENHFYKKIEGYYNDEVFSDVTLISMKDNLEKVLQIFNTGNRGYYNCTEGGAKINFIEQLTFKSFIEKYIHNDVSINNINSHKEITLNQYKRFLEDSIKSIKVREKEIKRCILLLDNNQNKIELLKSELEKCNKLIDELNLRGVVNLIQLKLNKEFKPNIHENIDSKNEATIRKNKVMFNELLIMFTKVENIFKKQIEKI